MPPNVGPQQRRTSRCACVALLGVAVAVAACTRPAAEPSPSQRFDYTDLGRFRSALNAIDAGGDTVAEMRRYIEGGARGLQGWHRRYGLRPERYASAYRAAPQFLRHLPELEPMLRQQETAIEASLADLRRRASSALGRDLPVPPLSYFVTPFGGGGSVEPDVVMIAVDYYGRNPGTPLGEFKRGFFPSGPLPMQSLEGMRVAIAHEVAHYYQRLAQGPLDYSRMYRWRRHDTLLARAVREGCAEFLAGLVVGHTTPDQAEYGRARERALWASFRSQLSERTDDNPGWFSGRHPEFPDAPWQIGYFVGARMCEAYYRSQSDSARALRTILTAHHSATQREMVRAYDAALRAAGGDAAAPRRSDDWTANVEVFDIELRDLQAALAIPGLAYVIVSDGRVVASRALGSTRAPDSTPFTTSTPLRIASVTKTLTSVIALQLAAEGRLDPEAMVRTYAPTADVPDGVRVRHLLEHRSEGDIGTDFLYSSARFALLRDVLEVAAGTSFEEAIRARVLAPAGMRAHPSPRLGAHGGLVSTVDDMGRYLLALDAGALMPSESLSRIDEVDRTADAAAHPARWGWFTQTVQGRHVTWSFGQDDPDHSGALLLRLPDRRLSLFLLANANTLSNPFRLLMGDLRKSPFAMSFLRLFAFSSPGSPLSRPARFAAGMQHELRLREGRSEYRFDDELIGWALIDLRRSDREGAKEKLTLARDRRDGCAPDPVVHFAILQLRDSTLRVCGLLIGRRLLAAHPGNRWMLLAQGYLLQQHGLDAEADVVIRRILELPNQEPSAYASVLKDLVSSGIGSDLQLRARQMLDSIEARPRANRERRPPGRRDGHERDEYAAHIGGTSQTTVDETDESGVACVGIPARDSASLRAFAAALPPKSAPSAGMLLRLR